MDSFKSISINLGAFESMSDSQKSKALQNLLLTLSASDYKIDCALLSLHASGLVDIEFYEEENELEWEFWSEILNKQHKNIEENEEDY